jgi:perosamine synthetase
MNYHWPTPPVIRIPVSQPKVTDADIKNVTLAVSGAHLAKGKAQDAFERMFGNYHGLAALTVSNGSVALMLALRSLGVGPGDEIIVPALSFAATASSVINVGAVPIFVDVDLLSWNISVDLIETVISEKTKAIIGVHNYGHAFDIQGLTEIANKFGLFVIEDTAEGLGGNFAGKPLGTFFDVATWSFYGNKIITSGEGGAVGTSNLELFERLKLLRGQGMDAKKQFYFVEPGFNFRLSNLNCSLIESQFNRFSNILKRRNQIFEKYYDELSSIGIFQKNIPNSSAAPWLFSFRLRSADLVREAAIALAKNGIETRPVFYPLPEMPAFQSYKTTKIENAKLISNSGISLPTYENLSDKVVEEICQIIVRVAS